MNVKEKFFFYYLTISWVICTDRCDHWAAVNFGGFIPNAAKNRPHVRSIRSTRLCIKTKLVTTHFRRSILLTQYPLHHWPHFPKQQLFKIWLNIYIIYNFVCITCHCRQTKGSPQPCFNSFTLNKTNYFPKKTEIFTYSNNHYKIIDKTKTNIGKSGFKKN